MKRLFTLHSKLFTSSFPFHVCSVHMHAHLFIFFIFLSFSFIARRATRLCLQKSLRKQWKGKLLPSPRPRPCTNPASVTVSGLKLYLCRWFFYHLSTLDVSKISTFKSKCLNVFLKGEKQITSVTCHKETCRNFCFFLDSLLHFEWN